MNIPNRRPRVIPRWIHLVLAVIFGFFLYSPWGDSSAFELLMQIVVFPTFALTGLWMWQMGRVRRLLARGRGSSAPRSAPREEEPSRN